MHGHNEIILLYNFNDITVMKNIFSWFRRVHYNRFWQYAFAILVCFFFSTLIFIPHRYFYSNDLYSPARLFVCSLTDRSKIISARSLSKKSFNGGENVTEENQDHFGSIKNVRNTVNGAISTHEVITTMKAALCYPFEAYLIIWNERKQYPMVV